MDKSIKYFTYLSVALIALFITMAAAFVLVYRYSTIDTYNIILMLVILVILVTSVIFIMAMMTIIHAYRSKRIGAALSWLVRLGLKTLLPFVVSLSGLVKANKDTIRKLYVDVNNILVESLGARYDPSKILILLPHCLQNSSCNHKITGDINKCSNCGRCCIGEISILARQTGVEARVVTGGTVARKIVNDLKPGIILSVACERDLVSGISDVGSIPVIGILNKRPNGPCVNTCVNVDNIREKLNELIGS